MPDDLPADRRTQSPQSVVRVVRLLEALAVSAVPLGLADLARAVGSPKSSVAALLRGLADEGLVTAADASWRLGPGAFALGSALLAARRRLHSSDLIRDGMRRLAAASGETVLFAVDDGEMLTYLDVVESRASVRFSVAPGDRRPLYCTAGGRALLAARPEARLSAYLEALDAEPLTARTETDPHRLAALIAAVRASGVAQTVDQAADGVTGTAAAIHDDAGALVGALIVAAPSARLERRHEELAELVRAEALTISRTLG